ncbi:MAG: anhydro-N-acetylmuramic acid kinase [Ahrensia sp.]
MAHEIKTAIGLMSGTSMDGIDVALVKTDGLRHVDCGPAASYPFEAAESQRIAACLAEAVFITQRDARPGDLGGVEALITAKHGEAVQRFLSDNQLRASDIDVIGFHGQTVLHRPEQALTVQLGDGQALANRLGIDVVYDMRANDMANGGQGAPLVPVFHQAIAPDNQTVAFVNIGGIANVTFVQPEAAPIAFDCGPGNALIDQWMQRHTNRSFDEGGALALSGMAHDAVVEAALDLPFFQRGYPKSLDRNDFDLSMMPIMAAEDGAATLAKLTALAITRAAETAGVAPTKWIIAGGGAHNRAILGFLREARPGADIITADEGGYSIDDMEAQAWAYLAVRSLRGLALTFPSTTGCVEPVTGGVLAQPRH